MTFTPPNVPSVEWIESLLQKAAQRIPAERLWVNPDCGLKTRGWPGNPRGAGEHGAGGAEFASGVVGLDCPVGVAATGLLVLRFLPAVLAEPRQHSLPAIFCGFRVIARTIIGIKRVSRIRVHHDFGLRVCRPQRVAHGLDGIKRNAGILTAIQP